MHLLREYLDDRGQNVSMERELIVADAVASGADAQAVRRALRPCTLLVLGLVAAGLLLLLVIFTLAITLERFMPFWLAWLLAMFAATPVMVIAARYIEPPARRLHCRGWLSLGLCPACAYRIAEVRVEEDNCRTCPECGAA